MLNKQLLPRFLFLTSVLLGNLWFIPYALGQNRPPQTVSNRLPDQWESSDFRPPSNGSPRTTQSGGRRHPNSSCINANHLLPTALVPPSGFGITQAPYPQISWYLPPNAAEAVEIIIFNEQYQEVYSTWYSLKSAASSRSTPPNSGSNPVPSKGEIMSLQISNHAGINPLEVGKLYYWKVSLICDVNNRTRDILTGGYLQRVAPDEVLNAQLKQASPSEQAILYANARLWYETLATVVKMQRQSSQDPTLTATMNPIWVKLLNSAGLEKVAEQPLYLGAVDFQP